MLVDCNFAVSMRFGILLLLLSAFIPYSGSANAVLAQYGVQISSAEIDRDVTNAYDSMLTSNALFAVNNTARVERLYYRKDKTFDLYVLIAIVLFFGIIQYTNSRYFYNLWRSFRNPELSQAQLKDQMMTAGWTGLFMNIFFAISFGTYLYYLSTIFFPQRLVVFSPSVLLLVLISLTSHFNQATY